MKYVCAAFILCCVHLVFADELDRLKAVDIDAVLKNDRLLNNYIKCMLNEGRCNKDGNDLKKFLTSAISNKCAKCSENEKPKADKIFKFLKENRPEEWKKLLKIYDPKGEYLTQWENHGKI